MLPEENKLAKTHAYHKTFETDHGRVVLHDLLEFSNMLLPSYSVNDRVEDTIYREGQRSVALRLLHFLDMDIAKLKELIRRRKNERELASREWGD